MKWIVVALVIVAGWEFAWWIAGVRPITPGQLKALLTGGEGERPGIIDVRTPREYAWLHIPGAVSHPDLLLRPAKLSSESKDRHLVLICLSGHRAPVVAFRLKKIGFEKVSYLSWGMLAWMSSGGETVNGRGER